MELHSIQWFEVSSFVAWTIVAMLSVNLIIRGIKRRTLELETTASALAAHYGAVDRIVDDPALPLSALEFISAFSHVIADQSLCHRITDRATLITRPRGKEPSWAKEMDQIAKTRPDLSENFNIAIHAGFIALFNRWPGTSWKLQLILANLANDRSRRTAFADRVAHLHDDRHDGPMSGGMVTA